MQFLSLPINSSLQNNLDINFHWNRRPLTIWRLCWQPFWKWWHRKNDTECKFHHYQPIPRYTILLDINFHWSQRPLTIWRFCCQPFSKWWPRKHELEGKLHHYQPAPHFKILLDINFHWNRRPLTIWRFCWQPFLNGGLVKMTLNANFIITNQFLTSK